MQEKGKNYYYHNKKRVAVYKKREKPKLEKRLLASKAAVRQDAEAKHVEEKEKETEMLLQRQDAADLLVAQQAEEARRITFINSQIRPVKCEVAGNPCQRYTKNYTVGYVQLVEYHT